MSTGVDGLPGRWMVLLCRIFHGEGIWGLIGVNFRSSRRSSNDLCDSWMVLNAVLMVHTWHSVNTLDLGKW